MEDTKALIEQLCEIKTESFETDFPLFSRWARRNNIFQTSLLVDFLNKNSVSASSISAEGDKMMDVCSAVRKHFRELPPELLFSEFPEEDKEIAIAAAAIKNLIINRRTE